MEYCDALHCWGAVAEREISGANPDSIAFDSGASERDKLFSFDIRGFDIVTAATLVIDNLDNLSLNLPDLVQMVTYLDMNRQGAEVTFFNADEIDAHNQEWLRHKGAMIRRLPFFDALPTTRCYLRIQITQPLHCPGRVRLFVRGYHVAQCTLEALRYTPEVCLARRPNVLLKKDTMQMRPSSAHIMIPLVAQSRVADAMIGNFEPAGCSASMFSLLVAHQSRLGLLQALEPKPVSAVAQRERRVEPTRPRPCMVTFAVSPDKATTLHGLEEDVRPRVVLNLRLEGLYAESIECVTVRLGNEEFKIPGSVLQHFQDERGHITLPTFAQWDGTHAVLMCSAFVHVLMKNMYDVQMRQSRLIVRDGRLASPPSLSQGCVQVHTINVPLDGTKVPITQSESVCGMLIECPLNSVRAITVWHDRGIYLAPTNMCYRWTHDAIVWNLHHGMVHPTAAVQTQHGAFLLRTPLLFDLLEMSMDPMEEGTRVVKVHFFCMRRLRQFASSDSVGVCVDQGHCLTNQ